MQQHGEALVRRQLLVARLADMAIDTFGLGAALSRLQGLLEDDQALSHALVLAEPYFRQAAERLERNREALVRNDDPARVKAARLVYDWGGYPLG